MGVIDSASGVGWFPYHRPLQSNHTHHTATGVDFMVVSPSAE